MGFTRPWRISTAGIAWARQVSAQNPTLPVILSNPQLLNIDPDGTSPLETDYGKMLWEKLIRDNDQIFMTLNGHHHGAAHLTKSNDFGHKVAVGSRRQMKRTPSATTAAANRWPGPVGKPGSASFLRSTRKPRASANVVSRNTP